MQRVTHQIVHCLLATAIALFCNIAAAQTAEALAPSHEQLRKLFDSGNYNDALSGYKAHLALAEREDEDPADDLIMAVQCLKYLSREEETDALIEDVVARFSSNPSLLSTAGYLYSSTFTHEGTLVSGEFMRGNARDKGETVDSFARDRVRALQLLLRALELTQISGKSDLGSGILEKLSFVLMHNSQYGLAGSALTLLSDTNILPDYAPHDGRWYPREIQQSAPVDLKGVPIFYKAADSFAVAHNDGERWRWVLEEIARRNPKKRNWVDQQFADFLRKQFDTSTLLNSGMDIQEEALTREGSMYALSSLSEDETIARLATGIKRLKLPGEFNFIRIYKRLTECDDLYVALEARQALGEIFENRRQFSKAADYWKTCVNAATDGSMKSDCKEHLDRIIGAWGQFGPQAGGAYNEASALTFRYRNATHVEFTSYRIKTQLLLEDVKDYLKSNPRQLEWSRITLNNIGARLVHDNQVRYRGERVGIWSKALSPKPDHSDSIVDVEAPFSDAGGFLVEAKVAGGNKSYTVVWRQSAVILSKPLDKAQLYYLADAATGVPLKGHTIEFFGYRQEYVSGGYRAYTKSFTRTTDDTGTVIEPQSDDILRYDYQWLLTSKGADGTPAYLGFTGIWPGYLSATDYREKKPFVITDRPVYRPGDTVQAKVWLRDVSYENVPSGSGSLHIAVNNPRSEKIFETDLTTDSYGGAVFDMKLPVGTALGNYSFLINEVLYSATSFRVEEYKKPEFEVHVTPKNNSMILGDTISATISANYYHGAPVSNATVSYKVYRKEHNNFWFPADRWDWLYGPGYWWRSYEPVWLQGWSDWGCKRFIPWWMSQPQTAPVLVAEQEVPISQDGKVEVSIDTAFAKEAYGNTDHEFEILAEVVDASRRMISAKGSVIASRRAFEVKTWIDRGYYAPGDSITAYSMGRNTAGENVVGSGEFNLYRIRFDNAGSSKEDLIRSWKVDPASDGRAHQSFSISEAGQYRISYTLRDDKNNKVEGAHVFSVIGRDRPDSSFAFSPLEIVPDRSDYAVGTQANIRINSSHENAQLLVFTRPESGVYKGLELMALDGKSGVYALPITKADIPNIFVEVVTIFDGEIHGEIKEILVPPPDKSVTLNLEATADRVKPGEHSSLTIKATDSHGLPFRGSLVLSVYDKSVEYISGGSNVPNILEHFWKWRRSHYQSQQVSVPGISYNLYEPNTVPMQDIGVFGHILLGSEVGDKLGGVGEGRKQKSPMKLSSLTKADRFDGDAPSPVGKPEPSAVLSEDSLAESEEPSPQTPVTLRQNFADTALWVGQLETDENGLAHVPITFPESLTTWKVRAWAMGKDADVGEGSTEVVTAKNIVLRMQAPRFFVEGDEVVLSGVVHNYLPTAQKMEVSLELDGFSLSLLTQKTQTQTIPSGAEARIDWRVKAVKEGQAIVRMYARGQSESDAMELKYPVNVHGILKTEAQSSQLESREEKKVLSFVIPEKRRAEQTKVELRYSPSIALSLVDALPYLISYPYGCTEQTLNRFVPAVVAARVLSDLGLDLEALSKKSANLNAAETGAPSERAAGWKRFENNPVFDPQEHKRIVADGVERLVSMQLSDGGWGWFSGLGEYSYPHTTATIVHGLLVAREYGASIKDETINRGLDWLENYQANELRKLSNAPTQTSPWKSYADNMDALLFQVLAEGGRFNKGMGEFCYRDRTHLSIYGKALAGLAYSLNGSSGKARAQEFLVGIKQFVKEDAENQTAYLNLNNQESWWFWYGNEIESHAYFLKLLNALEPGSKLSSGLAKYLLNNRKHGTYWTSTRDTALAIEALAGYVRASKEQKPNMTVEILLDGKRMKTAKINSKNIFDYDDRLVLEGDELSSGKHEFEIRRQGEGTLYLNLYSTNFTTEDQISKSGLEIKVDRQFFKLVRDDRPTTNFGNRGQAINENQEHYKRIPLSPEGAALKSGDLVEVELTIETKNDYEYLLFEDMKAAGLEAIEVQSGYNGNPLGAYVEYRDNRIGLFVRELPRGKHSIHYRLRAEIPGRFSALPVQAQAMYAPELRANSDEFRLEVED